MNYPEYVEIDNKMYKINTDFRIAIKCDEVAQDKTIGNYERSLAIIYMLFGDEGLDESLNDINNHEKLLEYAIKFLSCGKENNNDDEIKVDMDYMEDMDYIETSFLSDYGISLENTQMHWWKFYNLLCGLSNSEFGNCCILNRIRNIRNYDISKIKDDKTKNEIIKAQELFALKKYKKENNLTQEEEESMRIFNELAGL